MENDREVDSILMNVKNTAGGVMSAITFSARVTLKLLSFVGRMAKKGLIAGGLYDKFKNFNEQTGGEYTTYNIPLSEEKVKIVKDLQNLELQLENEKNPFVKSDLKRQIASLEKSIPEIQQLNRLGISHCVLPKLNGSMNTMQVAIAKKDEQHFKNWFLNHLTTNMTGGEKSLETLKVFTEGSYSVLNMPFEKTEELDIMLSDFNTMGINYSVLLDLNVGDGYTQVAVANADRSQVENWFKMWKEKLVQNGEEPKDMYEVNADAYASSAELSPESYIDQAEDIYKEANQEFEQNAQQVAWQSKLGRDNNPEFVKLSQDNNYEKITINIQKLVDYKQKTAGTQALENEGYFLSRLPGMYGADEKQLVLPKDKVFLTDNNETAVAFLDKRESYKVLNVGEKAGANGKSEQVNFDTLKEIYDKVTRGFKKTESMGKTEDITKNISQTPNSKKPPILK